MLRKQIVFSNLMVFGPDNVCDNISNMMMVLEALPDTWDRNLKVMVGMESKLGVELQKHGRPGVPIGQYGHQVHRVKTKNGLRPGSPKHFG